MQATALVVFDLDGTLVDSRADIAAAFNHGLRSVGAPTAPPEGIYPLIGSPLKAMYEAMLSGGPEQVAAACQAYRTRYVDHCADSTRPFPGVIDCLDQLATFHVPLAVATTKKTFMAVELLTRLGMEKRFALIQGTDGIPPKPDPALLRLVLDRLGVPGERAWMVGDTVHDVLAAQRAGMRSCAVTTGATPGRVLTGARPTLLLDSLAGFPDWVD